GDAVGLDDDAEHTHDADEQHHGGDEDLDDREAILETERGQPWAARAYHGNSYFGRGPENLRVCTGPSTNVRYQAPLLQPPPGPEQLRDTTPAASLEIENVAWACLDCDVMVKVLRVAIATPTVPSAL